MRIVQVITGLPKSAGTTTFVVNVTAALKSLGHSVEIVTLGDLPRFLAGEAPDVIHIHALWSRMLHQVFAWARQKGVPVVWSTHGMTAPWALHHKWWKKCLPWYLVQRRDLKRADLIHCTTELEEKWNRDLGFKRTFIAPLGTTLPFEGLWPDQVGDDQGGSDVHVASKAGDASFSEATGTSLPRLSLPRAAKTLLYVGRIYPVKALDNLIRAFALTTSANWRLRLVGPDQGGHMAELIGICKELRLPYSTPEEKDGIHSSTSTSPFDSTPPKVAFVGPKFDADLEAEYANCDALALVSHTENFGATVVDAMAHGKPVITSTKTPWRAVEDEKCGWWVDNESETLAKALEELFAAPEERLAEMGRNGRALVEREYTWQAVARKIEAAYCGL